MRVLIPLVLGTLLVAGAAFAVDDEELRHCAAVEEPSERLACYDGLARALMGNPEEHFGKNEVIERVVPDAIESTLTLVEHDAAGAAYLHLANGQVWRVKESNDIRLLRGEPKSVVVEKASLGSFLLQIDGRGRKWRAKRVE